MIMLNVSGLTVKFGNKTVINNLSFQLKEGQIACLMGRNGQGKSVLLKTLIGINTHYKGDIFLGGSNLKQLGAKKRAKIVSIVLIDRPDLHYVTVRNLVSLGRYPYLYAKESMRSQDQEYIDEALKLTQLEALQDQFYEELSDGQKQRVFIARALAQNTKILLLDEPTTFLDLWHRYEILKLLKRIAQEKKITILFSSHEWMQVSKLVDDFLLLFPDNTGKLLTKNQIIQDRVLAQLFPSLEGISH